METYFISCLILLTSLVEVHSEEKAVNRGESVLLFANVTADITDNEVHLYINGEKNNTLIATWIFENERITMVPNKYLNISMDPGRNIWIHNVDETYQGKYSLYKSSRSSIELIVLDSSQTKSENPSQNISLWIVGCAFVIVSIAFFLYVARTKKWGKKIRPCHKRRHGKHQPPEEPDECNELVSDQKRQNEDMGMHSNCSKARMDKLEDEHNKSTIVGSSTMLERIQDERADRKDKLTVSSEKPQDAEEDMNYLRVMARLDVLDAEVKKLKAEKASQEESMLCMNERLEDEKRKNEGQKATETIQRLENEIRKKEEENRKLKEQMEGRTHSFTNDFNSRWFQRNRSQTMDMMTLGSPIYVIERPTQSDYLLRRNRSFSSLYESGSTLPEGDLRNEECDQTDV